MTVERDEHAEGIDPEVPENAQELEAKDDSKETGADNAAEDEDEDEDDSGDVDDDEGQQTHGLKFTPEQQKAFDKAMSRKQPSSARRGNAPNGGTRAGGDQERTRRSMPRWAMRRSWPPCRRRCCRST